MSTLINVRNMLITALPGITVYSDFVPETESDPAVALINVAFDDAGRVLEGDRVGRWSTWRVQVVASSTTDVESIIDSLESIDNTQNSNFQRIFVQLVNIEAKQPNQPVRRAFVDVRVYN